MTSIVLEGPIANAREREVRLLHDVADTIAPLGEGTSEDKKRLQQNAADLQDMFFLVVVVGEFNAGKSSFVNALLGDEVLPMGITPTTDAIELVRWAPRRNKDPEWREPGVVREWTHPNTGGPGVVIVDTPGTGSVFRKHETIAKNFLSRSDLVIFLLSAKRAFAETERLYLELARDYGKKIIVVINQMDLLEKKEQKEVQTFVQQQLNELLGLRPDIFMVSAKQALKDRKSAGGLFTTANDDPGSMNAVREYLRNIFKRVPPAKQKLYAQLDFVDSIARKYIEQLDKQIALITSDTARAETLRQELEQQAVGLNEHLETARRELDKVFVGLRERGQNFIQHHLTLQRAARALERDEMREDFEREVVGNALDQITTISEQYVNAVVDNSRRYWRSIMDRLKQLETTLSQELGAVDATGYAEQRAALQEAIAIADSELKSYTDNSLAENLRNTFRGNLAGFSAGFAAALGGILAVILGLAAPGAVTATAGALVATVIVGPALLVGGGAAAMLYWRKIKRDASTELDKRLNALQYSYHASMVDLTNRERNRLLQYGQQILTPVFSQLGVLKDRYQSQRDTLQGQSDQSKALRKEIDSIQIIIEEA
ncbi:MAG TPA: dynamin family protein [Aggregatilineaceae bacterium]|nr:dynamin family protein [Aggregatilineaceae bacterium]